MWPIPGGEYITPAEKNRKYQQGRKSLTGAIEGVLPIPTRTSYVPSLASPFSGRLGGRGATDYQRYIEWVLVCGMSGQFPRQDRQRKEVSKSDEGPS